MARDTFSVSLDAAKVNSGTVRHSVREVRSASRRAASASVSASSVSQAAAAFAGLKPAVYHSPPESALRLPRSFGASRGERLRDGGQTRVDHLALQVEFVGLAAGFPALSDLRPASPFRSTAPPASPAQPRSRRGGRSGVGRRRLPGAPRRRGRPAHGRDRQAQRRRLRRAAVERTFAWARINRRLVRDVERFAETAKAPLDRNDQADAAADGALQGTFGSDSLERNRPTPARWLTAHWPRSFMSRGLITRRHEARLAGYDLAHRRWIRGPGGQDTCRYGLRAGRARTSRRRRDHPEAAGALGQGQCGGPVGDLPPRAPRTEMEKSSKPMTARPEAASSRATEDDDAPPAERPDRHAASTIRHDRKPDAVHERQSRADRGEGGLRAAG